MLQHSDAVRHAHQLFDRMGTKAEALAAQRAMAEQVANHRQAADDWEKVRKVLQEMRGPRQT
ncbi:MAG: hypothetical protein AAF390_00915 [Pseudomonadota bacterium]